jgi:flagellar basal body-associated protein FliL
MEEEQKVEPLRDSVQAEKEESKWKKITIIFCVVAICSTILLVTFMVLYFTKDSDSNSDESNSSSSGGSSPEPDTNPEDKWD